MIKLTDGSIAPLSDAQTEADADRCATRREFVSMATSLSIAWGCGVSLARSDESSNSVKPSSALVRMSALDLSRAIRSRSVSCVEVMNAYLDHIEELNPRVNAIVSLQPRDGLLRQARERDAQLVQGQYLGWMHGFPHAVKDLEPTKGIRTTFGSSLLDGVPDEDSILVERLKAGGAIIIGKTNAPEFGLGSQTYNSVFGTTLNAYDQTKTAGGSSGGAAVSLALRMLPVADGSDMMGSLRNPGAFNNVFGFRPSFGRVPSQGEELFLDQLGYAGGMGRSVADLSMLMSVIAGPDKRDPLSIEQNPRMFAESLGHDFKGTRLGWLGDLGGHLPFESGIIDLCKGSFAAFESLGCSVEEVRPNYSPERLWDSWVTLRHWLVGSGLDPLYADPAKRSKMKPEAQWEVEGVYRLKALDIYRASEARSSWYHEVGALFEHVDYLLIPSAQVFPFDASVHWPKNINGRAMDTYHRWMEVVVPASLLGCPVINVPVGFDARGLPMGMQIIGRHHADTSVLQLGHAYEQATRWVAGHLPKLLGTQT
jgi:amidase